MKLQKADKHGKKWGNSGNTYEGKVRSDKPQTMKIFLILSAISVRRRAKF
jgi:hypothetical protein